MHMAAGRRRPPTFCSNFDWLCRAKHAPISHLADKSRTSQGSRCCDTPLPPPWWGRSEKTSEECLCDMFNDTCTCCACVHVTEKHVFCFTPTSHEAREISQFCATWLFRQEAALRTIPDTPAGGGSSRKLIAISFKKIKCHDTQIPRVILGWVCPVCQMAHFGPLVQQSLLPQDESRVPRCSWNCHLLHVLCMHASCLF
jgi:hypothetical protein